MCLNFLVHYSALPSMNVFPNLGNSWSTCYLHDMVNVNEISSKDELYLRSSEELQVKSEQTNLPLRISKKFDQEKTRSKLAYVTLMQKILIEYQNWDYQIVKIATSNLQKIQCIQIIKKSYVKIVLSFQNLFQCKQYVLL